jgi:two-component system response regulator FixJ
VARSTWHQDSEAHSSSSIFLPSWESLVPRPPETPTVYLVEDDLEAREGLTFYLRSAGLAVGAYETAETFLDQHTSAMTGCLITDVRLPQMDGLGLIDALTRNGNRLPIIVMSAHADTPLIVQAIRAGAVDFMEKPVDSEVLLSTIRGVLHGSSTNAALRSEAASGASRVALLSPREREVFEGFAGGATTKQVADRLGLSPKTVEAHRTRMFEKLEINTANALVRLGVLTALFGFPSAGWTGKRPG